MRTPPAARPSRPSDLTECGIETGWKEAYNLALGILKVEENSEGMYPEARIKKSGMTIIDLDTLPLVLEMSDGITMTFLRNEPYCSRITVAAGTDNEPFYVPPHWHDIHDELFRVLKGRLRVMIGSTTRDYTAEDGEILVPRGVVHSIRAYKGEEMSFEERTEPMDLDKELFFRNVLADGESKRKNLLRLMVICYHGDVRLGLPGHIKWLERGLVTLLGGYIAPLFGYKVMYDSYKKSV